VQELPLIRLTFPEFRRILERCDCRFLVQAEYGTLFDTDGTPSPALYFIQRGEEGPSMREAMMHVWDETWIVPLNDIRAVCSQLDLDLSIFDTHH
jgi:hypothetical protein